jgi:mRNA interferase MazF
MIARGDIWLADLEPTRGAEASKTRPVIVVSNDARNTVSARNGRGVVTVVPLTSNTAHVHAYQARVPANPITGLDVESKAQAEQVRSLDVGRLRRRIGALPAGLADDLDDRLRLHLDL